MAPSTMNAPTNIMMSQWPYDREVSADGMMSKAGRSTTGRSAPTGRGSDSKIQTQAMRLVTANMSLLLGYSSSNSTCEKMMQRTTPTTAPTH
eukprot:1864533-Prymnesium_polylepis.1